MMSPANSGSLGGAGVINGARAGSVLSNASSAFSGAKKNTNNNIFDQKLAAYAPITERLRRAQLQVQALKERIDGLRQAKEDDIDWETFGISSSVSPQQQRGQPVVVNNPLSSSSSNAGSADVSPPADALSSLNSSSSLTSNSFAFNIRRSLRGHYGKVYACDWGGDNITVASAGQDGKLIVWNGFTENKKDVIKLRSSWVMACAMEKEEGKLVATGGLDNTVSIYDTRVRYSGGSHIPSQVLIGHDGYISDIKFLPNGSGGITNNNNNNNTNGSSKLVTSSGDGTIGLWDLNASDHPGDHNRSASSFSLLRSVSARSFSGKSSNSSPTLGGMMEGNMGGASSMNLGSGGGGRNSSTGIGYGSGSGPPSALHGGGKRIATFAEHTRDVMSVAVHPLDPNIIVSGSCDNTVRIWDIRAGHSVRCFGGHVSDVNAVCFFPSGAAVASGSDDSSVRMFDLRSSGPVNILTEERVLCGVTDVSFSHSGRLLFASYEEPFVIAWETASKEGIFHELRGHRSRISSLGVNLSGNALLTASWDWELAIWA